MADLLQFLAFIQMKLSSNMLNSARRILTGFNRATTMTLGDVTLLVKARLVIHRVLFSIVKDLRPCNSIVGRTWLNSMKAMPSTYHQMVSYLTNVGQVDLLSSQLAVRKCYQLSKQNLIGKCHPWMIKPAHRNHSMPPKSEWKQRTRRLWTH